jgi:hypothetical protein
MLHTTNFPKSEKPGQKDLKKYQSVQRCIILPSNVKNVCAYNNIVRGIK